MPGFDLDNIVEKLGKLPVEIALYYAEQIVVALEYLFLLNLINRDIKPKNVFVDFDGTVRVPTFPFVPLLAFAMMFPIGFRWATSAQLSRCTALSKSTHCSAPQGSSIRIWPMVM